MGLNGKYSVGILLTFVLLAAVMLYIFPVISIMTGAQVVTAKVFLISRMAIWMVLGIIVLYSLLVEKQTFLLWKEKKYPVLFYLKAVLVLYFICSFGGAFLNAVVQLLMDEKISDKLLQLSSVFKDDYFLIVFTCLTAGAVEELLMRGYLQPRIEKIYNSPLAGIVVSALLFGILHSTYGTISQVIVPFFIGVVFAVFYKKYSNMIVLIICHFMIDFISLMLMNSIDFKTLSLF
ncbi:MAG: CPBP family intramembrane metalloprotease [Chryseobacterium sp.]|jgi:membrane protease YdiL (CAAX protease family)|uniref:CPBP family intramembrane glutamic endopeptidase n=1 Tax=Chryseobacterium sp. TaxID=1871047 RepID=UPI002825ACDD|nr:type II CAAX endopeptidase family protein [Chryseobacterium sp.]MDR2236914.1 CPBP family intramembrane metalloprotease [Chryseobacterium sp.]